MIKNLDGTATTTFTIGLGSNQVQIVNSSGTLQLKNASGSPYVPASATWALDKFIINAGIISTGMISLSFTPNGNSEFVFWNGQGLVLTDDYTISTNVITFDAGIIARFISGDKLWVKYQY